MFTVVGMYLIDTACRKKLMAVGSGLMVLFALGISFSYANNYQLRMLIFVMLHLLLRLLDGPDSVDYDPGALPDLPAWPRHRYLHRVPVGHQLGHRPVRPDADQLHWRYGHLPRVACTNLICFLGVVTFVPETKDKTLEEIAELWKPKDEKQSNAQLEVVRATADLKQAESDIKAAEAELARARPCQGACHRHQGRSRSAGQRAEAALIPSCLLALCE